MNLIKKVEQYKNVRKVSNIMKNNNKKYLKKKQQ